MASIALWLLLCTLVLASLLVLHVALLFEVAADEKLPARDRLLSLLPPVLPIIAFRSGRRAAAYTWAALVAGYTVLRVLG